MRRRKEEIIENDEGDDLQGDDKCQLVTQA